MEEVCWCGHFKSDHEGHIGYAGCDGRWEDGNTPGGMNCYCQGYRPRVPDGIDWDYRPPPTLWDKIRKFLGV